MTYEEFYAEAEASARQHPRRAVKLWLPPDGTTPEPFTDESVRAAYERLDQQGNP